MISPAQAGEFLSTRGIGVPSVVLSAAMELVAEREPAMIAAGYSEAQITLLQSAAIGLIATLGAPRRLASQHAPSGASRSFFYDKGELSLLRSSLAFLDPDGILADLIPPEAATRTMLLVVG